MTAEQITVDTLVAATPEVAWRCWSEPRHITRWNFASDDWCCPRAEADLRPGGRYVARMEAKDGSAGFDLEAVCEEATPERAVALVLADGRRARTTFAAETDGTRVTTVFDAETANPVEMQREGWQAILDNFKRHAEAVARRSV